MNKYFKEFLHRGLMFGGFGPIIVGIVFAILDATLPGFSLSGREVLLAIVSTYILAYVQAGASVFNQIDHWSTAKSVLCHFSVLYVAYVLCYILNSWIPFKLEVVLLFTAIFAVGYFVVWTIVYLAVKNTSRKLNAKL